MTKSLFGDDQDDQLQTRNNVTKNKNFAAQRIDEKWLSETVRIGSAIVSYAEMESDYVWIYFAYSDNKKDFYKIVEYLKEKFYGKIVEYKTEKPQLFANHSKLESGKIYRWEH